MIISPPFLPTRSSDIADSEFVASGMPSAVVNCPGTSVPEGNFPVSLNLGWHGGIHLHAPSVGSVPLPVRAIADGEIVFARKPTAPVTDPMHPQNYNPYGEQAAWTDNGLVIVRHTTEIGDGENARSIDFFSIFMHLSELRGIALKVADGIASAGRRKIFRKEELGRAGSVYNAADHIHLEIVCDDSNCRKLIGRISGSLSLLENGRADAIYGEVYFHLPAGTNFYAAKPQANIPIPSAPIVYTSNVTLIVGIRHANGDGAEGRRGDDFLATYQLDGSIVGEVTIDPGAEYEMYRRAFEISAAFSSGSRPAPSAVYELLRFGRVVNTDNEHLAPADCPHWRYVSYANGKGWVNLNAYGITKYSDADFPHWKFWSIIDDDIDGDSRANSTLVNRLIGGASDPLHVTLVRQLDTPLMRQKLSRAICKFPSEWNRDTVDRRWGWLQTNADYQLIGEDWIRFRTHVEALAVPATLLPEALRAEHWHFHPSTFVTHFRMCQWLSASEFRQLVPKHAMRRHSGVTLWESVETNLTGVSSVAVVQRRGLNRMARKYGITSPLRLASFYGNAVQETNWLGRLSEAGGATLWYAPWYGRGFLQLTHPENYIDYWRYRGRLIPDALRAALQSAKAGIANQPATQRNNATLQDELFPQLTQQIIGWRDEVRGVAVAGSSDAAYAPADTAGFYWAKLRMAAHADSEHVLQRVVATTAQGPKVYYRSASFWRASAAVNFPLATNTLYAPGLNGFDARCVAYDYALAVLTEMYFPSDEGMPSLDFPEGYSPRRDQ